MQAIGGVKSKETRFYQKGTCNSPIFSTETIYAYKCAINIGLLHFPFETMGEEGTADLMMVLIKDRKSRDPQFEEERKSRGIREGSDA